MFFLAYFRKAASHHINRGAIILREDFTCTACARARDIWSPHIYKPPGIHCWGLRVQVDHGAPWGPGRPQNRGHSGIRCNEPFLPGGNYESPSRRPVLALLLRQNTTDGGAGGLNNRRLLLIALEAEVREQGASMVGVWREPSFGFLGCRQLPSHSILTCWRESSVLFLQGHESHHGGHALMTSSNRNHLPKAPPPNTIPLGVRMST